MGYGSFPLSLGRDTLSGLETVMVYWKNEEEEASKIKEQRYRQLNIHSQCIAEIQIDFRMPICFLLGSGQLAISTWVKIKILNSLLNSFNLHERLLDTRHIHSFVADYVNQKKIKLLCNTNAKRFYGGSSGTAYTAIVNKLL